MEGADIIDEVEPNLTEILTAKPSAELPQFDIQSMADLDQELPEAMRSRLKNVYYLHGRFEPKFIDALEELAEQIPSNRDSHNMVASRRFFRSEVVSEAILSRLPKGLDHCRVLPDMRFIEYPCGGYIAPHTDGVMYDCKTGRQSTTSFLLYLRDTNEGGTTDFLTSVADGEVIHSVAPVKGSILLFPHLAPHEGTGVGSEPKVLLRGDLL